MLTSMGIDKYLSIHIRTRKMWRFPQFDRERSFLCASQLVIAVGKVGCNCDDGASIKGVPI